MSGTEHRAEAFDREGPSDEDPCLRSCRSLEPALIEHRRWGPRGTALAECLRRAGTIIGDAMPRYHFHLWDGQRIVDPTGTELSDAAAAGRYACKLAENLRTIKRDLHGREWSQWMVRVTDECGHEVFRVAIGEPVDGSDSRG